MKKLKRWWRLMTTDSRELSDDEKLDKAVLIMGTSIGFTLFWFAWGIFILLPKIIERIGQ